MCLCVWRLESFNKWLKNNGQNNIEKKLGKCHHHINRYAFNNKHLVISMIIEKTKQKKMFQPYGLQCEWEMSNFFFISKMYKHADTYIIYYESKNISILWSMLLFFIRLFVCFHFNFGWKKNCSHHHHHHFPVRYYYGFNIIIIICPLSLSLSGMFVYPVIHVMLCLTFIFPLKKKQQQQRWTKYEKKHPIDRVQCLLFH